MENKIKLGVLKETKTPPDYRAALAPEQAVDFLKKFPNVELVIQKSDLRTYTDQEYTDLGLVIQDDLSDCDILIGVKEVAIVEPDEEVMAHSDGMMMWVEEDTLLVNDYSSSFGIEYVDEIMYELKSSFPEIKIIEVPVEFSSEDESSACGINLNSVLTNNAIYVPVFGSSYEQNVLRIIKENSSKKVIPIEANGVCHLGGSVRCLTWQLTGENANKLISAAKNK